MKDELRIKILLLYPEYSKIYGPYTRKSDGRKIVILYDGKKRSARLLAKVMLEVKIGRRLITGEEVDHVDDNPLNDDEDNLQLLSKERNLSKQFTSLYGEKTEKKCLNCKSSLGEKYRHNRIYCSRSCKQRYLAANQYGNRLVGYSLLGGTGETHST